MEAIIKALQQFLTRDILYILGGGSVIIAVAYFFGFELPCNLENNLIIFVAGIAYVLGYLIQEVLSLTPILTTAHFKPNRFIRYLYKLYSNQELKVNPNMTDLSALLEVYPDLNERQISQIERTITLQLVGATMGSNWLVASIFFGLAAFESKSSIDIFLTISTILLSVFLISMAWTKGAQQMHMFYLIEQKKT